MPFNKSAAKPSSQKGKETPGKKTRRIPGRDKMSSRVIVRQVPTLEPFQDIKLHTEFEEDPFTNLMQAIHLRASSIISQSHRLWREQHPVELDMSALYCLAATVEEYVCELNPSKKRALDNESPPPSYLSDESFSREHVLKKFRQNLKKEDVTTDTYVHDDDD